ncbi:hypothetical protein AVEN_217681-1 [Araneus ventricosus]|uniref:Uncharacterized protein n=1 Tax=Araneus ventricosus TaxID=182803 RepID=A0A4Y2VCS5_ARAVE|nr:hypothetical protein AVEN_252253-1 [Araneus ventricosus]GBO21906.1 hypothetical protein AVEN_31784-1 [Araneus ventricosus]GBO21911.1 hypothetical protein AVEN_129695-1 [Araneus ventricosus]GBO21916.1 hypothetical protein AVEN_217681-1 [Araneus ventricosus]
MACFLNSLKYKKGAGVTGGEPDLCVQRIAGSRPGSIENKRKERRRNEAYNIIMLRCFGLEQCLQTWGNLIVKRGNSRMEEKERNRLDITQRRDLRLKLTKLEPNIKSLYSKHQAQGSR